MNRNAWPLFLSSCLLITTLLPSLMGHMIFGLVQGTVFYTIKSRQEFGRDPVSAAA